MINTSNNEQHPRSCVKKKKEPSTTTINDASTTNNNNKSRMTINNGDKNNKPSNAGQQQKGATNTNNSMATMKKATTSTSSSSSRRTKTTSRPRINKTKHQKHTPPQPPLAILQVFILAIGLSLFFLCRFESANRIKNRKHAVKNNDDMPRWRQEQRQPQHQQPQIHDSQQEQQQSTTTSNLLRVDSSAMTKRVLNDQERQQGKAASRTVVERTMTKEVAATMAAATSLPAHAAITMSTPPIISKLPEEKMYSNNAQSSVESDEDDDPPFVIFYNIWIARMGEKYKNTLRIVEEQLHQVGMSYAATFKNNNTYNDTNATETMTLLYYQTIGRPKTVTPQFMQPLCQKYGLHCIHLGHAIQGFEEITLQALHDFCHATTTLTTVTMNTNSNKKWGGGKYASFPPSTKVIYIHTKGAFHNRRDGSNERWRRHLTLAATSEHCLSNHHHSHHDQRQQQIAMTTTKTSGTKDDDKSACNVCGLLFYPVWTPFIIGNMWSASCSYISKLVPPKQFAQRMSDLVQYNLTALQNRSLMDVKLYKPEPWFLGLERYAAELWVGTHPNIQPCDVSVTADNEYWTSEKSKKHINKQDSISTEFVWSMAPRSYYFENSTTSTSSSAASNNNNSNYVYNNLDSPWLRLDPEQRDLVLSNATLRMREFFLLPGLILKWHILYNGTYPPPSSWVWDFYPDGPEWRQRLAKYGVAAILEQLPTEEPSASTTTTTSTG